MGIGLRRLWCAESLCCEVRQATSQQQLDLTRVASGPFGQYPQYRKAAVEMPDPFEMRYTLGGFRPASSP